MRGTPVVRRLVAAVIVLLATATAVRAEWPPKHFTNLKVLPRDITPDSLVAMMGGFTRALGVRCTYCHVGEENRPLGTYDFEKDDKPTKRKARAMLRMVDDINTRALAQLESRVTPAAQVTCETCHHGAEVPRRLQEVLQEAHRTGGLDSTIARYRALRDRYYGRAVYDFGSVPLADVATELQEHDRLADAVALNALNVEMNPESEFARRQYVFTALLDAFRSGTPDSAVALYHALQQRWGPATFPQFMLNRIGYDLLGSGRTGAAVAAFELNAEAFPKSANVHDSLGDALARHGDRARAIESYEKALEIDPGVAETRQKLEALRSGGKP